MFAAILPQAVARLPESLKSVVRITQQAQKDQIDALQSNYATQNIDADIRPFFTNVAGIMSDSHGYGVAPGAKWISGKIFNYAGYSATSWTLGGCQFVMCPSPVNKPGKDENCSLGADVVSCSWGEDDATEPYLKKIIKTR